MPEGSNAKKPLVIGIAGGTGSGKTTVVEKLMDALSSQDVVLLQHDWYYRDQAQLSLQERQRINYDHPNSLETELLVDHIKQLLAGYPVQVPSYDFGRHTRRSETAVAEPGRIIIIEGILVLAEPSLRELMDIRIFVDTDDDIRFIRRLQRDIEERGRTVQSVIDQYCATVKPMHLEFVEPSKRYADIIFPEGGYNTVAIDLLVSKVMTLLNDPS